jgi:hypothetical protein
LIILIVPNSADIEKTQIKSSLFSGPRVWLDPTLVSDCSNTIGLPILIYYRYCGKTF